MDVQFTIRYECNLRLRFVLVAYYRFNKIVHATLGSEEEKVAEAFSIYSPTPSCFTCGATHNDLLRCNGCKSTFFCNTACQKAGWKDHKPDCKRIRKLREKGQHTDLNAGLLFNAMNQGGGTKGVLGDILDFLFLSPVA